jgi:hypothetical protein
MKDLINLILGEGATGKESDHSLPSLLRGVEENLEAIRELSGKFDVEAEADRIKRSTMAEATHFIRQYVEKTAKNNEKKKDKQPSSEDDGNAFSSISRIFGLNTENGEKKPDDQGITLDIGAIQEKVSNLMFNKTQERAKSILKDAWDTNLKSVVASFENLDSPTLKRVIEEHEYEVSDTEDYERQPDGLWENVCSFFG